MNRLVRASPWVSLGGVFTMLAGLIRDARMHRLDPGLAAREGVFALDSPAHKLFALGLALIVIGTLLFLMGESFRRTGASLLRRAASGGLAILLILFSVNAFAITVSGQTHQHQPGHGHAPGASATPEQIASADKLVRDLKVSLVRYRDLSVAEEAGYRQTTPYRFGRWGPAHFHNRALNRDDGLLDPRRPESLMYFKLPNGRIELIGAMFVAPPGKGPRPGGPITDWHVHENLCLTATGSVALTNAQGRCPEGSFFVGAAVEMMHVWTFDHPGGPFAHNLDREAIKAVLDQYGGR